MNTSATYTLMLGALVALLLTGCPDRYARPDDFSDDPAPLLARIQARGEAVTSLSGQLSLEVWRDGERMRLRQLVAVRRPDRVRIDSLSPFDQPLSTLTSDGEVLSIYDMRAHRFWRGRATAENMARLLPIRLEPEAFNALLRGAVPIMPHDTATVGWDASEGWYTIVLRAAGRTQRISLEPKALRVVKLVQRRAGALVYEARLGDYSGTGDAAIPRRMRFEAPEGNLRIEVKVLDFKTNRPLPDAAFKLTPPRGIRVESLD